MRIAFIISAYRLPQQLVRLVERLQAPERQFYVHVDLKSPADVHARASGELAHHSNVEFLTRHACYWGGFGHVEVLQNSLESAEILSTRTTEAPGRRPRRGVQAVLCQRLQDSRLPHPTGKALVRLLP